MKKVKKTIRCPECGALKEAEVEYAKRQKDYARMFLDGKSLDEIVKERKRTRLHIAHEICFGAFVLRDEDDRARELADLSFTKGIGVIGAIKRYELKRKQCAITSTK